MEITLRRVHDVEASQFTVLANSPGLMTINSLYRWVNNTNKTRYDIFPPSFLVFFQ